jgi:hypothetical protein
MTEEQHREKLASRIEQAGANVLGWLPMELTGADRALIVSDLRHASVLAAELTRLHADNERMVEALKPFANLADVVAAMHPGWDHDRFTFDVLGDRMTLAPFRTASIALRAHDAGSQKE